MFKHPNATLFWWKSKKRRKKQSKGNQKRKRTGGAGADYNAARGLDFQRVSAVLNFDLPCSAQGEGDVAAYTHRIGTFEPECAATLTA